MNMMALPTRSTTRGRLILADLFRESDNQLVGRHTRDQYEIYATRRIANTPRAHSDEDQGDDHPRQQRRSRIPDERKQPT